ncbi:MAG: 2-hydroxyacid dehydrogenase [Solirubrobacteraceae bacterium]
MPPLAKPVVAVTRPDLPSGALRLIPPSVTVRTFNERRAPSEQELVELARGANGLLCLHTERIDESLLASCPDLVVVSSLGVGHEHLSLDALERAGVVAGYTPEVLSEATADLAWTLILAVARRVVPADRFVHGGSGEYPDLDLFVGQDLFGATLGIIGLGRIGRAVAKRARGFDMKVIHHSSTRKDDELSSWRTLEQLAEEADFISIHTPNTPGTHHLVDERFLRRMKPTAVLVNTSRGAVVDQTALVTALSEQWIFGAGLDVQEVEPIPADDPLLLLENCVVLPHIGSASSGARRATAELAVRNLLAGLNGDPLPAPLLAAGESGEQSVGRHG